MSTQPIGIFDSGIGGLTVARAVKDLLPQESLVYFGDTAHVPYGDKSTAPIQAYALRICDFLLQKRCKVMLIACNSASAAAYDVIRAQVGQQAAVFNVIDPMIAYIGQRFQGQSLLVPMIEAGLTQGTLSQEIIDNYLQNPVLKHISALILGCTHYPVIKTQLQAFYQGRMAVVEASHLAAQALQQYLAHHQLLSTSVQVEDHFIVSDLTPAFAAATRLFFQQPVHLEQLRA